MDTFKEMAWEYFDRYIRSFPEAAHQTTQTKGRKTNEKRNSLLF